MQGGILIGPTFFGKIAPSAYKWVFPSYSFTLLEPMAHFALVYYAFLMGLKMDIQTIRRTGTKAIGIALSGTLIPCFLGSCLFFTLFSEKSKFSGCIIWGFALAVTGYSTLVHILEKHSLIHMEVGKLALASAHISELISWGFLAVGLAVTNSTSYFLLAIILCGLFGLFCIYAIHPAIARIIRRTPEGQGYSEFYLCFILSGVALCGIVTDSIGTHPMLGAFIFGLIIPNEILQSTLVERLEDFVMGVFMPAFFAVCGIRTNLDSLASNDTSWLIVAILIVVLSKAKIFSTMLASFFSNLTTKEATTIGLLTSTKSILALIILEVAQQQGVLST